MLKKLIIIALLIVIKAEAQSSVLAIADSLYSTGNYSKAINYYAKEGSSNASLQIARAYSAIGNHQKASVQYKSIVDHDSTMQIASFELGKLLLKVKDYDEARKLFTQLVSIEKGNPGYYYFLGEAFRELEQSSSSLVAYKRAIEIDSTHLKSLFRLAKYFIIKKEKNQALHYIQEGLAFYPNDVALVNLKALALFNDAAYEEAIPWFERVLELGEVKEYIYEKLAYSYYKNWDFEKAKENYRTMLDMNDTNSETYFNLAEVYRKNQQLDSAEVFVRKGMDVQKPVFAKGYGLLGGFAREREDLKLALKYYKRAYKEGPNAMGYFQICTTVDKYYKDPKAKLEYFEKFLELYSKEEPYFSSYAAKRITELKEEIHFSKD